MTFDSNTAVKVCRLPFNYNPTIVIASLLLLVVILFPFQADILDISMRNISSHAVLIISSEVS